MRSNLITVCGVILFAAGFLLLLHRSMAREVDPQIQAAVRQELDSLAHSQASLRAFRVGPLTGTYRVGQGEAMTGYLQFEGRYSEQPCRVFVLWRQADTNAPIDKIEIGSTAKELRAIWSRNSG